MKSIIEEASSIAKAIEGAWNRAGNPAEFSIKVFELPEKNFFGMTTKKAKVGIFFETALAKSSSLHREKRKHDQGKHQSSSHASTPQDKDHEGRTAWHQSTSQSAEMQAPKPANSNADKAQHGGPAPVIPGKSVLRTWNNDMVQSVDSWLKQCFKCLDVAKPDYTTTVDHSTMVLTFNTSFVDDSMKEKLLFRSLIHLIMAFLRNKYKADVRSLKLHIEQRLPDDDVFES
jgi:predicted RNA-binding protein Jag